MSSASHKSDEYTSEESCPLVADSEDGDVLKILHKRKHRAWCRPNLFQPNFWTFITCVLVIYLFATMGRGQSQYNYENGYKTEFLPARQAVRTTKVKFSGGLFYDHNGTLYASSDPEEPTYIGPPSKEIDDAWEALIHDRYLASTPDQVKEVGDDIWYNERSGFYLVGMDVLHTLHCLNLLRMTQDYDHYVEIGSMPTGPSIRQHINHCINHLRQIVQCHGDMTPIPVVWYDIKGHPEGGKAIPNFDQVHTCRDFTALREWSTEQDQAVKQMASEQRMQSSPPDLVTSEQLEDLSEGN